MQNAECKMQKVHRNHSAFCILHSRRTRAVAGIETIGDRRLARAHRREKKGANGVGLRRRRGDGGGDSGYAGNRLHLGAAECRMQNAKCRKFTATILHSAFCILHSRRRRAVARRTPTARSPAAALLPPCATRRASGELATSSL